MNNYVNAILAQVRRELKDMTNKFEAAKSRGEALARENENHETKFNIVNEARLAALDSNDVLVRRATEEAAYNQMQQKAWEEVLKKKDRAVGLMKQGKNRLGRMLSAAYIRGVEVRKQRHELHMKLRASETAGMQVLEELCNTKTQRDSLENTTRLAEEETQRRIRIQQAVQKQLDQSSEELASVKKELGWIPSAFDSYKRGIDRIAPELSPMAQLAIMELERQADDWAKPEDDS